MNALQAFGDLFDSAVWRGSAQRGHREVDVMRKRAIKWLVLAAMLASSPAFADRNVWLDITRQNRDDAVLNEAGRACDLKVGPDQNGKPTSVAYKRCMGAYGWRLQKTIHEPPEKTWIDPDTGDTCRDLKLNGTVIGSSCGNF